MNYKTHLNGGILAGLYVSTKIVNKPLVYTAIFIGSAIIGSLIPDVDHKNSYIGRKSKGISKAINKIAGHRKLFHAPLAYLLLYSISAGSSLKDMQMAGINGLLLGILSHLILDSFTVGGLPWFYPLSKKKFSLGMIKTNGKLEDILCGILICINIAMFLDILQITSIFTFTQK